MFRVLSCVVFSCAVALSVAAGVRASSQTPKIRIFSCQVVSGGSIVPRTDEIGLAVRFRNESQTELASIVWRANYGKATVDFIDDGAFAPSVQIDNYVLFERGTTRFNWSGALGDALALVGHAQPRYSLEKSDIALPLYLGTEDPENCSIVRATSKTGDVWINPAIAQAAAVVPLPTPRSTSGAISTTDPIEVSSCQLAVGDDANLQVAFRNRTERAAERVVIRAAYLGSGLDFTDQGTFTAGALISHQLKRALPDALRKRGYISLDDPNDCAVASVQYRDGTTWQNPALAATPSPFATAVPNAMMLGGQVRWQRHAMPTPLPSSTPST